MTDNRAPTQDDRTPTQAVGDYGLGAGRSVRVGDCGAGRSTQQSPGKSQENANTAVSHYTRKTGIKSHLMGKHNTDPRVLSQQLLERLAGSGELVPAWSNAFAAVPRHQFIPDTIWIPHGAELIPLPRA